MAVLVVISADELGDPLAGLVFLEANGLRG